MSTKVVIIMSIMIDSDTDANDDDDNDTHDNDTHDRDYNDEQIMIIMV